MILITLLACFYAVAFAGVIALVAYAMLSPGKHPHQRQRNASPRDEGEWLSGAGGGEVFNHGAPNK